MRKKCVRWTKSAWAGLIAVAAVVCAMAVTVGAQSTDPSTLPLLTVDSLQYVGGFRLPAESVNGDSFSVGGRPMAFNPAGNSLFIGSRAGRVAEVSIPTLVNSADVNALPFASFLQPFADPTEGHLSEVSGEPVAIDGLMIHDNRLYGTAVIYYDANNTQGVSHYSRSLQLNQLSFSGWSRVWESGKAGFVSGLMALVPAEWQARLGGPAVTGQCCIPIVTRTSWGPAAFAFNPADVGQATVGATPLLYYTGEHPTLGQWDSSNPTYGATIQIGGMAIIAGTRTALYVGRNGTGPNCYGNGTSIQSLDGTYGPDGAKWCYDPTTGDKGSHAYPYRYQLWAYDLNEFTAVKEGRKQPWEVMPYGVWPFDLPTPEPSVKLGGVGYDAERQLLYVSQLGADKDGYSYRPIIHALQIDVAPRPPADSPAEAPAVTIVSDVSIVSDKPAPQDVNTSITFSAAPSGGVAPHQYKWWTFDGSAWTPSGDWTTSSQFTWVPTAANANARIGVWVRSNGNTADAMEASASIGFAVTGSGPTAGPVSSVSIVPNRVAPQAPGTAITWTATPIGGVGPQQYKWWVYDGSTWTVIGAWSTSNTFTWTPATANASYRIGTWVKSAGNTKDEMEASTSMGFPISGATVGTTPLVTPPATTASAPVSSVLLTVNMIAPQPVGASITWTATPSGGTGPYLYKWWTFNGDAWSPAGDWTSSNTFTWVPTAPNANYRIGIWAKRASNTADEQEASSSAGFPIGGTTAVSTTPVNAVTLSTTSAAPLPAGSTITWTATPTAGVAPHQYKWWVYNGDAWIVIGDWTTANTFAWTPTLANSNYRIGVWVRSSGNNKDEMEASTAQPFAITSGSY